ncbi:hypothetical protein LZ32DRAFT_93626 [Colletotrichum eremochloae]|nr:hypothetical protein LZ32DRAFT_93626 [Colletotrichum eremochloae]
MCAEQLLAALGKPPPFWANCLPFVPQKTCMLRFVFFFFSPIPPSTHSSLPANNHKQRRNLKCLVRNSPPPDMSPFCLERHRMRRPRLGIPPASEGRPWAECDEPPFNRLGAGAVRVAPQSRQRGTLLPCGATISCRLAPTVQVPLSSCCSLAPQDGITLPP